MLIDEKKLELFRTADTYAQMRREAEEIYAGFDAVSYTHLTLPTN